MHKILILVSAVVLVGCGGGGVGNLKKTAARDLGCTAKQIEVEQLQKARNGVVYEAHGCGRRAEYSVVKKSVTRSSEVTAYTPPPPPAPPPPRPVEAAPPPPQPQQGFTPEQQAQFFSNFERNRQQRLADQKAFFAENEPKPSSPPPPQQQQAQPASAPVNVQSSSEQSGYVCVNGAYHACPTLASTTALSGYAACRMKCMMGGNCQSCVLGEGEKCSRAPARDPECKQ